MDVFLSVSKNLAICGMVCNLTSEIFSNVPFFPPIFLLGLFKCYCSVETKKRQCYIEKYVQLCSYKILCMDGIILLLSTALW